MATFDANYANDLTGANRDVFVALQEMFNQYGLSTLAPRIADFIRNGYSADTIGLLLQDTPEYKQRFAANESRRKAGLPVLSPAEYLATERSYRQVMSAAGLPKGFYDSTDDFRKFLENDTSPQELQERVASARDFVNKASPEAKALFGQWYSTGDMIAYALDPQRAAPLVGRAYTASQIGAEATKRDFNIARDYAERIANLGVSGDQAAQGFGVIQSNLGNDTKLAALSGMSLTAEESMNELFFNDATVTQKRQRIADDEEARFGGSSAIGGGSLGTSSSGQI